MAIIYSYPQNVNILSTDILVGTSTVIVNGKPKNQTKSFEIGDLATFINAGNTLDTVLQNGNTSFLNAKIGDIGLYDPTEQDYATLNIDDSEFNFYNATGSIISVLTKDTLALYTNSYIGQLLVPNTITTNRVYTFPDQSGIVALTSDITGFVPYTGATASVNLGIYNLTANSIIKAGGTNLQFLMADGSVSTAPSLTGFVPYTGATGAVNLGAYNLTVNTISVGKGAGTGVNNTAIGNSVLISNTTGTYNVAIGFEALKVNATGGTNIAIGRGTMPFNTTGGGNTALGYNSMFSNTTGGNNVSIGNGVMTGNTTGSGNVAIGYNTLTVQGTVSNTIAIGQGALQFNNSGLLNTAVGYASMTANTSGSNNTALGASALQNNNTGSDNTAVGGNAISNNTTGIQNVGLGKFSSLLNATDSNCIVIGFNAIGAGSNTVTLGNVSTTTTRLRGAVQGGSFVKDGGTASQYLMADGTTTTVVKTTYMMTGVFTNMFGGDPGGLNRDVLEWAASSPNASQSSALPILQNCKITAAGFKWISSTPPSIGVGQSWTVNVYKLNNPLTDSTTADANYTLVGALNITLTSADNGVTVGKFSSGLNLILNAGDIIRIAGDETGAIATTTEETQLTVLFEVI